METSLGLCEQCSADVLAKLRLKPCTRYSCDSDEEAGHKRLHEISIRKSSTWNKFGHSYR